MSIRICSLLFFDWIFDHIFRLQFRFQKVQQAGHVLLDTFKTLYASAEGLDLSGDYGTLCLVLGQYLRIGLMADPVSDF